MSAEVEVIARAWMAHQGYTDEQVFEAEKATHKGSGCEWCPNHMAWICDDEDGKSLHPLWDALEEACAMARVAVEALDSIGSLNVYEIGDES